MYDGESDDEDGRQAIKFVTNNRENDCEDGLIGAFKCCSSRGAPQTKCLVPYSAARLTERSTQYRHMKCCSFLTFDRCRARKNGHERW